MPRKYLIKQLAKIMRHEQFVKLLDGGAMWSNEDLTKLIEYYNGTRKV